MKQLIVLRKDLNMRKGKMVAQGAHASLAATLANLEDERVKVWLGSAFTKIAVSVNSEQELLELYEQAKSENFITVLITDNGVTEFNGVKTNTCIAIGPDTNERMAAIAGHLKLL